MDLENIKAVILENLLIIKPDNSAQLMQRFQVENCWTLSNCVSLV